MYTDYEECIACGQCTSSCLFLSKYAINLQDYAARKDLAFHCFLCGQCQRVCPKHIDGRQISLDLREQRLKEGHNLCRDGYGLLIAEKKNFIFKNHRQIQSRNRQARAKTVLFPGCNFPAYYPKMTRVISNLLAERHSIPTIYDCCGKPIGELGLFPEAAAIIARLNQRFLAAGVEEIVVLCPNCYYYFKDRLQVKVTSIYEKLWELSLLKISDLEDVAMFMPCPDRESKELLGSISALLPRTEIRLIEDVQCCGAGGCAAVKEPEIACQLRQKFHSVSDERVCTYCATCSGVIAKSGVETEHILCHLLQIEEKPATGKWSLWNRALYKFT